MLTRALLVAATISLPAGASAATNQARNRCSDAVRILRSNPTMMDVGAELDPLATKNAVAHWNQVIDGWNRASKQIDQIPKQDLDERDPELSDCFQEVRKWGAYIKQLDARIKTAQEQAKVVVPFLESVKPMRDSLWPMVKAHFWDGDVFSNAQPAVTRRVLDDLAKVETACAALPTAGAAMPAPSGGNGSVQQAGNLAIPASLENKADTWCFVAKHRVALMTKALGQKSFSASGFGNYSISFPEAAKSFAEGGTTVEVWLAILLANPDRFKTALKEQASAWYGAAGLALPADPFPWLDPVIAKLRSAAEQAARSATFGKGPHDARLEKLGRAAIKRAEPSSTVLASAMDASDFTINKSGAGVPLDRYRSGRVLMKRKGASWCEERTFTYDEPYAGGGRYQKASQAGLTEATRLVACP